MKLAVGIATKGRPSILNEALQELTRQTSLPAAVFVCPADSASVDTSLFSRLPYSVSVLTETHGSSAQRNRIIEATQSYDILVFFDDDFPAPTYLETVIALLATHPSVVLATGVLLADGIHGPGLSVEEGRALLRSPPPNTPGLVVPEYGAYGCNMVVRLAQVYEHKIRFDEQLPLYGWQEDIDFSRQLARHGSVVRASALNGVHLGVKAGRTSGVKFGYSQISNPLYLVRKGTMTINFCLALVLKNVAANLLGLLLAEQEIDRAGRVKGNVIALVDLLCGRLHPTRILKIS